MGIVFDQLKKQIESSKGKFTAFLVKNQTFLLNILSQYIKFIIWIFCMEPFSNTFSLLSAKTLMRFVKSPYSAESFKVLILVLTKLKIRKTRILYFDKFRFLKVSKLS